MACFGSATPVSALVGRSFPAWLASALRLGLAAAVLAPLAIARARSAERSPLRSRLHELRRGEWLALVGMAVVGTFGFSVLMLVGMRESPGAVAATVMATTPAVTATGAVLFLGDRFGRAHVAAVALAVAGVVVVNVFNDAARGGGDRALLGSALIFGAVLCEATYSLLGKRLSDGLDPVEISLVAAVGGALAFLPIAAVQAVTFEWSKPSAEDWVSVAWWGAGTMALGSIAWFAGMRRVQAATAAAFMGVMPISALLGSYILLGESFQWLHLVGIGSVLAGLVVIVKSGATVH
jgi:drug/metabolite transporter (DMT)-like permease